MITTRADRTADPLKDHFWVDELTKISPWSAEQIKAIGPEIFQQSTATLRVDIKQPQKMSTWISVISQARGENWEELDVA